MQTQLCQDESERIEIQMEALTTRVTSLQAEAATLKERLESSTKTVTDLDNQMKAIEDEIFQDFCANVINVDNIREFESETLQAFKKLEEEASEYQKNFDDCKEREDELNVSRAEMEVQINDQKAILQEKRRFEKNL